ncbi:MAG: S8 family serine peptidase [Phycisphaerales bacterium]
MTNHTRATLACVALFSVAGCEATAPTATPIVTADRTAPTSASITERPARNAYQPTGSLLDALQPKAETGVDRFLQQFPDADGRGITIAIFDTGVDPGAPGLQTTPQGEPKIIDIVDGSGSGDVDTSTVVTLGEDGTITGLTGRTLTPDPAWINPTGEFRIGAKAAYDLFPAGLVGRYRAERRDELDKEHRELLAAANRELAAFDRRHTEPDEEQIEERAELAARVELLTTLRKDYDDPGPIFDCLVWNDGSTWRAAIDTDSDGDFADETALTNFRDERRFATFGDEDLLNFVLNIYNDGDVLSVVADAGSHGTHVAGIAAAYFPDQPELNGMAPGAQIVSVKIGDTRLGSSSVNTGFTRGVVAVLENDADLINMSYGGPSAFQDTRYRIDQLATELVHDHGVVFVSSAGNSGPALSTVGGPGGTTSAIIGVGASITPDMMEAQYAVREGYAEMQYPWSSRGPALDGDLGVDITAPGGAISPVPNWTLQKNQLSNGTSMSAPSACGGIALILSKLEQDGTPWHPASVKRAVQATAVPIPDQSPWAQGAGMLQVDAAYEYLANYVDDATRDVRFEARGPDSTRGIYLREPYETDEPTEISIDLTPSWPEDTDNRRKVDFEMRLKLEATEPWIETARFHNLASSGRSTTVRVDPTGLQPGAHFAQILAYDEARPERGPAFTMPVTVIKGIELDANDAYTHRETITTTSGQLQKWFFHTPDHATWMDVIITRRDDDTSRTLVVHTTQLREDQPFSTYNSRGWVSFNDEDVQTRSMRVDPRRTVELAIAQNWSSLGQGEFDLEVRFRGLSPEPTHIVIDGAAPLTPIDIHSPLRDANIRPAGSLTGLRRSIRPIDWNIEPLDDQRDMLPDGRQIYQIVIDYELTMDEKAKVTIDPAVLRAPHAWEEYESFFWMVFDKNDKPVAIKAGDNETVELDKGDYTIALHIRHDQPDMLEALGDTPLILTFPLSSPITLQVADRPEDALAGRGGFGTRELDRGSSARAYIATPAMPDQAEPGDLLIGSMTFGAETDLGGSTDRPDGWPVTLAVAPKPNDKPGVTAKDEPNNEQDEPSRLERLEDDIRDLRIKALADLHGEDDADAFETIAASILADDPDSLAVPLARMHRAAALAQAAEEKDHQPVLEAAEAVIAAIDLDALAAYRGIEHDEDADDFDRDLADRMADAEATLKEALSKIVSVRTEQVSADDSGSIDRLEDAIARHERWAQLDDDLRFEADLAKAISLGRHASAAKLLRERLDSEPSKSLREQIIEQYEALGWALWRNHEKLRLVADYPKASRVF